MSLIDYEEVRPWARAMKQRTALRDKPGVMPPWFIEKDIGIQGFKNDPSLSEEEILKIGAWADNGAPRGDPADMPPPVAFIDVDEWEIGEPDLIVSSPSVTVQGEQPDWWGSIGETTTALPEDRYVAAIEYKEVTEHRGSGGRNTVGSLFVFHHATMGIVDPDASPEDQERARLGGWPVHEVGRNADYFNPEAGRLLPAGATVVFNNNHLHANGAETRAHLDVGFKFHPRGYEPTLKEQGVSWAIVDIDLEAMDADQELESYFVVPDNLKLTIFEPHLHAPGVRMCLEAIWGRTREMLNCGGVRPWLGQGLYLRGRHGPAPSQGDHPAPGRLLQQLAVESQRPGSAQLVRRRAALGRPDVHQPGPRHLPDRRRVRGRKWPRGGTSWASDGEIWSSAAPSAACTTRSRPRLTQASRGTRHDADYSVGPAPGR